MNIIAVLMEVMSFSYPWCCIDWRKHQVDL